MRFLLVHGVGFHEADVGSWAGEWCRAIERSAAAAGAPIAVDDPLGTGGGDAGRSAPGVLFYEDLMRRFPAPGGADYARVLSELLRSAAAAAVDDWFGRDRERGLGDGARWKARQIAAWASDDALRAALRRSVVEQVRAKDPRVVVAHSFGGLIVYDACLFEDPGLLTDRYLVTIGTQLGNPLVRREFGGRQLPVDARHWFNVHNPRDPVFVAPLDHIRSDHFSQVVAAHGARLDGTAHDAPGYLAHPAVGEGVWKPIAGGRAWLGATRRIRALHARAARPPDRRALLVGVDRHADPAIPELRGCVNDTFLLSAALQESGFDAGQIRLLHDGHVTRDSLLDRIGWLLDDVRPGDHRFLSFSGHGHRMPSFDVGGRVDGIDEVLVTHDYDFTDAAGLRDRDIQRLYADLDPGCHFAIFLDCCHSGAIRRSAGPLVRGIAGPPDIMHQCVRWNAALQMWEQRELEELNPRFLRGSSERSRRLKSLYYGSSGAVRRLGRASCLRDLPYREYDRLRAALSGRHAGLDADSLGPYLPLIFMACGEDESACEYVHGSVSYGAFTYALVQALRDRAAGAARPSYGELVEAASRKLAALGYSQSPALLAHPAQRRAEVPFGRRGRG